MGYEFSAITQSFMFNPNAIGGDPVNLSHFAENNLPVMITAKGSGWEVISHCLTYFPDKKSVFLSILLRCPI